jgi:hypothetical protein
MGLVSGIPFLFAASETPQAATASTASQINYGEDTTRPLARFDIRLRYRSKADGSDELRNLYQLDYPFRLPGGWKLSTRTELPMTANDTEGADNSKGVWRMGLGDVLNQVALVSPENNSLRYAAGLRVVWPSETNPTLGSGKYQIGPGAAVSYTPAFLTEGSFFQFIWREPFGVGGDKDRKDTHRTVFNPGVNVALPHQFYVEMSPEMVINWSGGGGWFVPFNLNVGKEFGKRIIVSLEWNQAVVKDYRPYDWDIESRIGYFF